VRRGQSDVSGEQVGVGEQVSSRVLDVLEFI